MRFTTKLLPSHAGNVGILTLNHPKALHALTSDMLDCLQDILTQWYCCCKDIKEQDKKNNRVYPINCLLLKADNSETKRPAFCAGGNVKQLYETGIQAASSTASSNTTIIIGQGHEGNVTADFFRHEYWVNHMLYDASTNARIPQVSFWDGVVMGGGAGISLTGSYRVATEHTLFAMPETAIGLFPDVGSCFWFPRILQSKSQSHLATCVYLALTGHRLKAADLLYTGLATHYVPSKKLPDLEYALIEESKKNQSTDKNFVAPVLMSFHEPLLSEEPPLKQVQSEINHAFGNALVDETTTTNAKAKAADQMEDIIETLTRMDTEFSQSTLKTLSKMSPTSLKITLEALRRGLYQCKTLEEDLQMEYRLAQACMRPESDFYRGVKAAMIDKPATTPVQWNPATLEEVTPEMVESYFAPIEHEWVLPPECKVPTTTTTTTTTKTTTITTKNNND